MTTVPPYRLMLAGLFIQRNGQPPAGPLNYVYLTATQRFFRNGNHEESIEQGILVKVDALAKLA